MDFHEGLCKITVEGAEFEAWGAVVTPERIIGYLASGGILTTWHGEVLGTYTVVARWRTPQSYVSLEMWQVEAVVDGIRYTGRSAGIGMVFKGKVKKRGVHDV